jgi:hypothetical protein
MPSLVEPIRSSRRLEEALVAKQLGHRLVAPSTLDGAVVEVAAGPAEPVSPFEATNVAAEALSGTSNRPSSPSAPATQLALRIFTRRVCSLAPGMPSSQYALTTQRN